MLAAVAAIVAVVAVLGGIFAVGAWRTPGQSFQAKWADWLRAHHAAAVATAIEQYYDSHHQPPRRPAGPAQRCPRAGWYGG